jgi:hypothetical protein
VKLDILTPPGRQICVHPQQFSEDEYEEFFTVGGRTKWTLHVFSMRDRKAVTKVRQLGTVVGVPSWGGLVGIVNGQRTIDNSRVEQSNNAFYGKDGKWIVENHGADPDVLQDNDPASAMAGKDLQLEKAVETALKKIKEQPWQFPPVPKYPKK